MKPSLTIVLPVHNVEATLSTTVSHILEWIQEAENRFEVLLIDNGSQDDTFETASSLGRRYSQVNVARVATKGGFGSLMTIARAKARADWLCVHCGNGLIHASEILPLWRSHGARHRRRRPGRDDSRNERWARRRYDAGHLPGLSSGFQILSRSQTFQSPQLEEIASHRLHHMAGQSSTRAHGVPSSRLHRQMLKSVACRLRGE